MSMYDEVPVDAVDEVAPDTVPTPVATVANAVRRLDWKTITGPGVLMIGAGVILIVIAGFLVYSYVKGDSHDSASGEHEH